MIKEMYLWVDKYRPNKIDDYIFTDEAVKSKVHEWISTKNIPHILLYGPPGTGKTSIVNVLISELGLQDDVKYFNASNTNSVDDIRKVIDYAPQIPLNAKFRSRSSNGTNYNSSIR